MGNEILYTYLSVKLITIGGHIGFLLHNTGIHRSTVQELWHKITISGVTYKSLVYHPSVLN